MAVAEKKKSAMCLIFSYNISENIQKQNTEGGRESNRKWAFTVRSNPVQSPVWKGKQESIKKHQKNKEQGNKRENNREQTDEPTHIDRCLDAGENSEQRTISKEGNKSRK